MATNDKPEPISPEEIGELFTFNTDPSQIVESDGLVTVWALAWFPSEEWDKAIEQWPELLETLPEDHSCYTRQVESYLKAAAAREPGSPDVAPLSVDALITEFGERAGELSSRATAGANIARKGGSIRWPPKRNDHCWCSSGLKYKACCGTVPAAN